MTWLTKLRTYLGHDEPSIQVDDNSAGILDATQAYENSKSAFIEARQRREVAREIVAKLSDENARNHFGESIELAMMRRRQR